MYRSSSARGGGWGSGRALRMNSAMMYAGLERVRLDVGFHHLRPHVELGFRIDRERSSQRPQIEHLPSEVAEHAHAIVLVVRQRDRENAPRSEPTYQVTEGFRPMGPVDVVEDVGAEDEIRLRVRPCLGDWHRE